MIGAIMAGEKINDFEKSTPFNLLFSNKAMRKDKDNNNTNANINIIIVFFKDIQNKRSLNNLI